MNKKFWFKIILSVILFSISFILFQLKDNPQFAEEYCRNFVSNYYLFIGNVTSITSLSVHEIIIYFLIIYFTFNFFYLISRLFKRQIKKFLIKSSSVLLMAAIVTVSYTSTATMTYGRGMVDIPQYQQRIDKNQVMELFNYHLNKYNALAELNKFDEKGNIINPYNLNEMGELIAAEYRKFDSDFLFSYTPKAKTWITSFVLRELHLTGIYFGPTGEVNLNYLTTTVEQPYVLAHEFAHAKGVMRESDANLVAMYITINSEDPFIQFAGYYYTFYSLLSLVYYTQPYQTYVDCYYSISDKILKLQEINYDYWKNHDLLSKFQTWWYDFFLKFNGTEDGVDDYTPEENKEDTGNVDEDNRPIYEIIEYSTYQKLYMSLFFF